MPASIITQDDLRIFKEELLDEIKEIINEGDTIKRKQWLKSSEVKKFLQISEGSLRNLRVNGTLPHSIVGGIFYYDYDDIVRLMELSRIDDSDF